MSGAGVFVARDQELARLDHSLGEAVDGRGRVCFVIGEAGTGKTALVREFARRAQEQHADLIVAVGQSDAQTGIGDPYLPFRELLAQLTGDVDAKLAQGVITEENAGRLQRFLGFSGSAIVEFGPDLVGAFIPGVGLAARAAAFIGRKTGRFEKLEELTKRHERSAEIAAGGIEQSHIFEQYTNVVAHLARETPLLLILDDLQWVDVASSGLLFRLGRSIGDRRVLVVGTYRPAEVAIGRDGDRHPLEKVVAEFKRYFGDVSIDLGEVAATDGQRLVAALLDAEDHRLSDEFRRALFDRTAGHPLFTIELLRALQERGDLVRDAGGRWIEGPSLHWDTLPARVEGVIEERIGRLEDELQETLTVASVEGEDFTAEVVARVQHTEARQLVRRLGHELEQQHRLVRSRGVRRLAGDGSRLSLYRFHHNLFQRYLYRTLKEADRAYLHEDVGNALEDLCADCADEFVVQLARHFVEAGITDKAAAYLRRAGALSVARFANDEAADYFTRALALTPESDSSERFEIISAREQVYGLQGAREAQAGDLAALRRLADDLHDDGLRAEAALRTADLANVTGDFSGAIAAAEEAIRFAATGRDVAREARAHVTWGTALMWLGRPDEARARLECALGLAEGAAMHRVQATSLKGLSWIHLMRGELAQASAGYREALRICQRLNDAVGEAQLIGNLGIVRWRHGDLESAQDCFEQVLERMRRMGDRVGESIGLHNLGEIASERHDYSAARESYRESLAISVASGDQAGEATTRGGLGFAAIDLGLHSEAEDQLHRSLDISEHIGQQSDIGFALAGLGRLSCSRGEFLEASDFARQALDIACGLAEPRLEGFALDVLGHSLEGLGKWADAVAAYDRSLGVRRESHRRNAAMTPAAGLARIALARGDIAAARSGVDEILAHLETGTLDGADGPIAIYLACHRVLHAAGDPRAGAVLADAHALLAELADRIDDPEVRRAFLADVPANHELLGLATDGLAATSPVDVKE